MIKTSFNDSLKRKERYREDCEQTDKKKRGIKNKADRERTLMESRRPKENNKQNNNTEIEKRRGVGGREENDG